MSFGKKYRYMNEAYSRGFKRGAKIYFFIGLFTGAVIMFLIINFTK